MYCRENFTRIKSNLDARGEMRGSIDAGGDGLLESIHLNDLIEIGVVCLRRGDCDLCLVHTARMQQTERCCEDSCRQLNH